MGAVHLTVTLLMCLREVTEVYSHYHPKPVEVLSDFPSGVKHIRGPHHPRHADKPRHEHYTPQRGDTGSTQDTKLTQDKQLLRDEEHIREDLGGWISKEDTKKMSGEELEFHYFKLHDFDNNTKLDGLEILQAIQHIVHDSKDEETENEEKPPQNDFNYYIELIDKVLAEDDLDNDGYLSYIEYVLGRQKDDHELKQQETGVTQ